MNKPELTFPIEVQNVVREYYEKANIILEYGSGGSTVLASEIPNKVIYSVESDKEWASYIESYISQSPLTKSVPLLHYVDIGPTKKWGHPKDDREWRRYYLYPSSIWRHHAFDNPDLILIDGRFRAACFFVVQ